MRWIPFKQSQAALISVVALGAGVSPPNDAPHLFFVLSDYEGPHRRNLTRCERLTIDEYVRRGVRVTEVPPGNMKRWLENDGKMYAGSLRSVRLLALARQFAAQAIGGLEVREVSESEARARQVPAGPQFYSWGISLAGFEEADELAAWDPGEARAIPIRFRAGSRYWELPSRVRAAPCVPAQQRRHSSAPSHPTLGIVLDGGTIERIYPGSPIEAAGLHVGDTLVSVDGRLIGNRADLQEALVGRLPGSTVDVAYEIKGVKMKVPVRLADYAELMERLSPMGRRLPDFEAVDINGNKVRLSSLRGKVVMLDFWATWCSPCIGQLHMQQHIWQTLRGKGFEWLAISVDEDEERWRAIVRDNHLGGTQVRSPEWAEELFISGYPTILLVDRDGVVQCRTHGDSMAPQIAWLYGER